MSNEPTTNKPDAKRWPWFIIALLPFYVLSMGPAFHFWGMKGLLPYTPIIIPACLVPEAGRPVIWYLNACSPDGTSVDIVGHDLIVSERR